MTQEACGENLPSLERARNFKTSKRSKDEVRKQKKFQVFNPRQRRSFGKNHIYCPLQGHSTTDYVLSESTGSVFSTGFVRDNIGTEGRGVRCKGSDSRSLVSAQGPHGFPAAPHCMAVDKYLKAGVWKGFREAHLSPGTL